MMSLLRFLKKLVLFVLIVAIAIPLRYGSTNPTYLFIRLLHSTLSLKHSLIQDRARPTLSTDYRAFENLVRLISPSKIDPLADPLSVIKEMRSRSSFADIVPKSSRCQVSKEIFQYDGHTVDAYWVDNRRENFQNKPDKVLLYYHDGCYFFGDIQSYSGIECHLSRVFNVTILHLEYRLSPEHPLSAAIEDTVAVYRTLLHHNISSSQLIFMGDSAGGGLALLTIQAILAHQLPVPRGVIVLSPWTDLSGSGETQIRNAEIDLILRSDNMKWMDFLQCIVGTAELLEDDSRRVAKKAQDEGVDVTFEEGLHMMHAYPLFFPYYPEARKTLDNINLWIQTIFTKNHRQ